MTFNLFNQISVKIIKEQELIIGPVAWDEAKKVPGLTIIDSEKVEFSSDRDSKKIVDGLVAQYERLFGRASNEVCKEAVRDLIKDIPSEEIPSSLR